MQIRRATVTDAECISTLLTTLSKRFIAAGLSNEGVNNLLDSMTPSAVRGFFTEGYRYHVGTVDQNIIGVVGTRDNSHLFHLFVDEKFHGKRYASELWQTGREACLDAGNPGYFTVNSSLNAQEVYKRWGFVPLGGIREGGGVRDIPMRMELSDLRAK